MEVPVKGTVTSLSSLFTEEEAQKAAERVYDTITEKQKELDRLRGFIADNTNLINQVQRLPDELHHDIMVPFGKFAFFPGSLTHTNEFLVLLGEGYYAERTSKQTVDILKRREKALESQADSFKAVIQDLRAEASFFDATASEVAEGLVDIREDYVDGSLTEGVPEPDDVEEAGGDEEYARIMSRLDELEVEEREAESGTKSDFPISGADHVEGAGGEEEYARMMSRLDELEAESVGEGNIDVLSGADSDRSTELGSINNNARDLELKKPPQPSKSQGMLRKGFLNKDYRQRAITDQTNVKSLTVQSVPKGKLPSSKSLTHDVKSNQLGDKDLMAPEVKKNTQRMPSVRNEVSDQRSKTETDSLKAFTGCIVEHSDNIQMKPKEQTATPSHSSASQPLKRISRFKMQRQ